MGTLARVPASRRRATDVNFLYSECRGAGVEWLVTVSAASETEEPILDRGQYVPKKGTYLPEANRARTVKPNLTIVGLLVSFLLWRVKA